MSLALVGVGAAGSVFDPLTTIGAPLGYWNAEQYGGADAASVTSFTDFSGNANHLTTWVGTPVIKTGILNGRRVLRCTDDSLRDTFTNNLPFTVVMAIANVTCANNDRLFDGATNDTAYVQRTALDTYRPFGSTGPGAGASAGASPTVMSAVMANDVDCRLRANGTQFIGGTGIGATTPAGFTLAGAGGGGTEPTAIDYAIVLLYAGKKSDAELLQAERWMGGLCGITVS